MPWITATLAAAVVLIHFLPGASHALQSITTTDGPGNWWTWWTGHLSHWNGSHLFWDVTMLIILGSILEWNGRRDYWVALMLGAPLIILSTVIVHPELSTYRGLSGWDCILAGLVCCCWFQHPQRRWMGFSFGFCLLGKALLEAKSGVAPFAGNLGDNVQPLASAHIVGFAVGVIYGFITMSKLALKRRISSLRCGVLGGQNSSRATAMNSAGGLAGRPSRSTNTCCVKPSANSVSPHATL